MRTHRPSTVVPTSIVVPTSTVVPTSAVVPTAIVVLILFVRTSPSGVFFARPLPYEYVGFGVCASA